MEHAAIMNDFLQREREQFRDLGESLERVSFDGDEMGAEAALKPETEERGEFTEDPTAHGYSDVYDAHDMETSDMYKVDDEDDMSHRANSNLFHVEGGDSDYQTQQPAFLSDEQDLPSSEMFYKSKSSPLMSRSNVQPTHMDEPPEEPEVITEWKEKQRNYIEKKDVASARKKADALEEGQRALEKFYEEYNYKKTKNMTLNQEREDTLQNDRGRLPEKGKEWEQVCRYLDLNLKTSKSNKDVSRMKSILLQLKNEK
jgi:hypothetical protein